MPWSIALRTMCSSGSNSISTIALSASVSSPSISSFKGLPRFTDISRTTRGNRCNTERSGSTRMAEHGLLQFGDEPVENDLPFLQDSGQSISFFLRELRHMPGRILGDRELAGQADEGVDSTRVDPAEFAPPLPA